MAKEFFRFLRGELNGFYINSINNAVIKLTESNKEGLLQFANQQFEAGKIDSVTLYNLGRFAGVQLPRRPLSEAKSSLYMTESAVVDNEEISEKGLYNTDDGNFEFQENLEPNEDINSRATSTLRSSLVGSETVEGYISEDATSVLDDDGNVRPEKVLSQPPEGKAYSNYYGNEFLFLSEGETTYESISFALYIELFKVLQWIRYNGVSLASLVKIISILCPDGLVLITGIEVAANKRQVIVHYSYNTSVQVTNKEQRLSLLQYIIGLKFKQVRFTEAI